MRERLVRNVLWASLATVGIIGCTTVLTQFKLAERYTVKVFVADENGRFNRFGSGFYAGTNLVMTARHVVDGASDIAILRRDWWWAKPGTVVYKHPFEDIAGICTKESVLFPAILSDEPVRFAGRYYIMGNSHRRDFDTNSCVIKTLNMHPPRMVCKNDIDGQILGFSGGPVFDENSTVYGSVVAQISAHDDLSKNVSSAILPLWIVKDAVDEAKKLCN